ncbi:MAG TPA: hypothetical protein VKO87_05345, partial [Gemmatimonadaceae bacterium]|nr:hypothetical protein [Gemmatimonadaceae bacterium]
MIAPLTRRGKMLAPHGNAMATKPFDIDTVVQRIRKEIAGFKDAAMFALRTRGFTTVFQQLVGCIISIRTLDEVSLPAAVRLLEKAPDASSIARLSEKRIDELISTSTFHETKARQIRAIAVAAVEQFGGELPADSEVLMSFNGVGPKCANLALGVAAG